jgi:arabinofuranan 3-O-arabinosyltransferase
MGSTPSSFRRVAINRNGRAGQLLLAVLAFVPPLLTAPGQIAADTKQYLYLNPSQLMRTATSLWDPAQFGGYVTHQTIGYLWPAGPWYWLLDKLGAPDWVAQRLWLGLLFFAAGQGVWRLARHINVATNGAFAAAALYQLSPYVVTYANRTSILLAPWAGLGWIMTHTIRAARHGGWRNPAIVALVVATVGGINATALVLLAVAPLSWLLYAAAIEREIDLKRAFATVARVGALSAIMSCWWLVALAVQSRTGADVLAYSETTQAVSSTSSAPEVLRGLGYWLFYGGDSIGAWNSASTPYVQSPGLILLGFALVAGSMVSLLLVARPLRLWLTSLWLIGTVVAVGAHGDSWLSHRLLSGNARSTLLLAFRSSTRAVPLVLLASSLAVGLALSSITVARPVLSRNVALTTVALAVLQLPAVWNGSLVDAQLRRSEDIPAPWLQAARALEERGLTTRILELPGQEFSTFRWGTTTDQLLPGLLHRPAITRDLLPLGGSQMMDLLLALDNRIQDGTLAPQTIAPVARLLGSGDVVIRGDERFEKYQTPRPERVSQLLSNQLSGLGTPTAFGAPLENPGPNNHLDAVALSDPAFPKPLAAATIYPVSNPVPIVRTEATQGSVLVAGSGDGLVAAADLLPAGALVRYSADAASDQQRRDWATEAGLVVIADSNRKRAQQWRGSQNTVGMTEDDSAGVLTADSADVRLPLFANGTTEIQTLALQRGGTVRATAYGETNAYRPEDRAVMAFDGDPTTFWRVADRADAVGQRIEAVFTAARPAESIAVHQPPGERSITELDITTDVGQAVAKLDERSQTVAGQPLGLAPGMTTRLSMTIAGTTDGGSFNGQNSVGLDVTSSGEPITESVRPPIDLGRAVGKSLGERPLAIVLSRERADAASTYRSDPEPGLVRILQVPVDVVFTITGNAHAADRSPDSLRSASLSSSGHLEGSEAARVVSAFDGDRSTRWVAPMGQADGSWISVDLGGPRALDHLDLIRPTGDRFSTVDTVDITLDGVTRTAPVGLTGRVQFDPLTGRQLRITFHSANPRMGIDPHFNEPRALPVAVSEIIIPGWTAPASTSLLPTACRSDLLMLDGTPVATQVDTEGNLSVCGAALTMLTAGEHTLASAPGVFTGIDIDRLLLRNNVNAVPASSSPPTVQVETRSSTETIVQVARAADPFVLVFGQGWARGWEASANGKNLGAPTKVDGGSMGWSLDPSLTPATVTLTWRPQRFVNAGLLVSALGAILCLLLVVLGHRRPSQRAAGLLLAGSTEPAPHSQLRGGAGGTSEPAIAPARGSFPDFAGVVTVTLLAAAAVAPWAAVAVVAVAIAARLSPFLHRIGIIAGVACIGFTGVFVAGQQFRHHYFPGFGWPQSFNSVHTVALLSVISLVLDACSAPQNRKAHD